MSTCWNLSIAGGSVRNAEFQGLFPLNQTAFLEEPQMTCILLNLRNVVGLEKFGGDGFLRRYKCWVRVKMGCELGEVVPRKSLEGLDLEDVDSPSGKRRQDHGRRSGGCERTGGAWRAGGAGRRSGDWCCWNVPRTQKMLLGAHGRCLFKPLRNQTRSTIAPIFLSERLRVNNSVD